MNDQINLYKSKRIFERDPSNLYLGFENGEYFMTLNTHNTFGANNNKERTLFSKFINYIKTFRFHKEDVLPCTIPKRELYDI